VSPPRPVLIVEDDADLREMMAQLLTLEGYHIDTAANGREALEYLNEAPRPDVILLDLMMPKLDGFGVIERLRANSELRNIPIIVISAKELTEDESKTLKESVAFVMKKQGFDGDLLKDEINSVMKK
jgi:CheY-like chemotaxis protein